MGVIMSWTDERINTLKRLWARGESASLIAATLGSVTRNAIIGKVHRLGLSGRATMSRDNKSRRQARARRKDPRPVQPTKTRAAVASLFSTPDPLPPQQVTDVARVSLVDIGDHQCRWGVGDPKHANFGFCGADKVPGLPYCSHHARRAYEPKGNRNADRPHPRVRAAIRCESGMHQAVKEFTS